VFAPTFLCTFLATMTLWTTQSTDEVIKKLKKVCSLFKYQLQCFHC